MPEDELKNIAAREGATYISAMEALCPSGQCVTMAGRGPQNVVALDYYHLTDPGSRLLLQRIANRLFGSLAVEPRQ
jgi:hypothetical protein